jgi:hypothetical protein
MSFKLNTPIVFLIFNRPETTLRVFEAIRRARPTKLLIIADGPRLNNPKDYNNCVASRSIVEQVDWDCNVHRNYSDINLGCKQRVISGLNWVFEKVTEAIILEDDCLPDYSFFQFAQELLNYYQYDSRIMSISGNNFQFGRRRTSDSYYFSRYPHSWGWATWRRAWQLYDPHIKLWTEVNQGGWLKDILDCDRSTKNWANRFQSVCGNQTHIWDYQWTFCCWIHSGLSILPNVNLVSNIGFSEDATHTKGKSTLAEIPVEEMQFPLMHPLFMIRDIQSDIQTEKKIFKNKIFVNFARKLVFGTIKRVNKFFHLIHP